MANLLPRLESIQNAQNSKLSTNAEDDQSTNKAPQSSVTFIYEAKIADLIRNVTVTWSKNVGNYSLVISVENPSSENPYTFKLDIKAWQFWGKKGLKSFDVDTKRVDVYWDLRQAKFSSSPVPSSDYYVAVVDGDEVSVVLGDMKMDAYKRTKKQPPADEPVLLCKKENVHGKKLFCTKTMWQHNEKEHDLTIETSLSGLGDPEMWISIDGFEVVHIMNLQWRFRGNENLTVNDVPVQIFWDVHDWLFNGTGTGQGLFVFSPGNKPSKADDNNSSPDQRQSPAEFFHVIYAWKFE
ncbi:unnamed protein product [Linum trigynum]|uniref:Uncharacterized protein n=1 Tax=Linum trigynum TaxID=586398 RepID=A0AAV2D3S8_9ROSI